MKASIIVSIYNKIEWLELILASVELQSEHEDNFELIISDDGSKSEVVDRIDEIKGNYRFKIIHNWHPDNGWDKNTILNKSVVKSSNPLLIFIDGDCILHKEFIKEHINAAEKGKISVGRRVSLTEKLSIEFIKRGVKKGSFGPLFTLKLLIYQIFKGNMHAENGIYIRSEFLRKFINNRSDKGVLGCNYSMLKEDMLYLNGFDERYKLPAVGEDTDLEMRARKGGIVTKTLKHLAIQYHLYHKILPRDKRNLIILEENRANNVVSTKYGIKKSL